MDIGYIYVDILTGENCLMWTSFIGQLVHPVGGRGWGKGGVFDGKYRYFSQLQVLLYSST